MATMITSECINCGACEPECPNTAIYQGAVEWQAPDGAMHAALSNEIFYIVPEKCTECVGFHDHEACAAVCPVDCCVPNPDIPAPPDVLLARARVLHPGESIPDDAPSRFKKEGAAPAAAGDTPAAPAGAAAPVVAAAPVAGGGGPGRAGGPRRRGGGAGPAGRRSTGRGVGTGREAHRAASAAPPAEELLRRAARRLRPDRHRPGRTAATGRLALVAPAARPARGRPRGPRGAPGGRQGGRRGSGG